MYHCATFQLIWKTSDSETKFAQKVHGKNFEKIDTKIKIRILQGTPALRFTQFGEYSTLVLNLREKNFREKH